jgi:hypothetical protein
VLGDGGDRRPVNASRLVCDGESPRPKLTQPNSADEQDGHASRRRRRPPVVTSVCQGVTLRDGQGTATRRFTTHSDDGAQQGASCRDR